ncbi:MAG TPA: hypothetical protein VM934_06730 [Pyrinomonadaceae bacterium]|nr:hypothetical protein [Pyrinomonadaceae bacterium]
MNRKLIRTTLAEVKGRNDVPQQKERGSEPTGRTGGGSSHAPSRGGGGSHGGGSSHSSHSSSPRESSGGGGGSSAAAQGRKRIPPAETNAEIFYYKKQMDAHTLMVIVLLDGEEVEGTIEWYDRAALKINRKDAPNIMLLKHQIKYMFKAEDRDGGGGDDDDSSDS